MSEKTEEPSPRRLRQAREKGDVPVSAALVQTAGLVAATAVLPSAAKWMTANAVALIQGGIRGEISDPRSVLGPVVWLVTPVLGAAAVGALAVGMVQTGGGFFVERLVPKLENLDPVEGVKRLFKLDRIYQVVRALVASGFVAWLAVDLMLRETASIAHTTGSPELALVLAGTLVSKLLWLGAMAMGALACLDVLVTRKAWLKRNRMSKDEVKREHKDAEGDPQLKHDRKRAHQEMLSHAAVLSVKDASVVVVNPTHLATALRYQDEQDEAPIVVAQGQGELAKRIVDAARAYGIPVVRDVPVAHALRQIEIGEEIPEELYEAVAEILKELWEQASGEVLA